MMPAKRYRQITLDDQVYHSLIALKQTESESFGDVIAKLIKEAKQGKYEDGFGWWTINQERKSARQNSRGLKIESRMYNCQYLNCFNKATTEVNIRPLGLTPLVCDEHIATLKMRYQDDISETKL